MSLDTAPGQSAIGEIAAREWDVVVVGTGMGGGTLGRRLAEAGLSVLFVERGPLGFRAERQSIEVGVQDPFSRQIRGFWPLPVQAAVDGREFEFFGPIGSGVGGSSVFYAGSLERPERHELDHSDERPHPTGGWPVGYDAFRPYFEEVERLYHICGEHDPMSPEEPGPLADPPPMSEGDRLMMEDFQASGLHPYRAHIAIRYLEGCEECIGIKCPRACKMDARSAGVEPALSTGNAALLDRTAVVSLESDAARVTGLKVRRDGEEAVLRGRQVVLACGALSSPRLLLASANEHWPEGLGNRSGLVGRNLMFHLHELIAVWPRKQADFTGPAKPISLRDFYYRDGMRFGNFQSFGMSASYGNIVHFLNQKFDRSFLRKVRPLREFVRIPALIASKLFGKAKIYDCLFEDFAYPHNRVVYDPAEPDRIRVEYTLGEEMKKRRTAYRSIIKRGLRPHRTFFLNIDPQLNYGHSCGTLRFGTDPDTCVLDTDCRAHGIENLWVADSSFMPTSNGINPSLTIAANALRVADALAARMGAEERGAA